MALAWRCVRGLGPLVLGFAVAHPTVGAAAESDFYRGKTLTVIVGSAVGGAYDQYARLFARHIVQHLPGTPAYIVQNMPGAGSVTAVRYIDVNAPKDGTAVVSFNSTLLTSSLTAPEMVKMKFTDVAWVGAMTHEFRVCYAWHTTGLKTWDDLVAAKEFIVGATGTGTAAYVNGAILRNLMGVKVRQILGYAGSAQQRIAVERGEMEGGCSEWNAMPENWIQERKIYPLVRWLPEAPAGFDPSVPYIGDLAKTDEAKAIIEMLGAPGELGNPFVMSKQVPADRLAIMRAAFEEMMTDKTLLAEAEKLKMPIEPTFAAEAERITAKIYADATPELIAKAKEAMK